MSTSTNTTSMEEAIANVSDPPKMLPAKPHVGNTSSESTMIPGVLSGLQEVEMSDAAPTNRPSTLGKRSARNSGSGDDLYGVSSDDENPKKRARALENLTTADSSSVPKPSKGVTVKPEKPLNTQHIRKGDKGVYIGVHIEDDELPVFARYYPNGPLNCRVYHEDCSEEVKVRNASFFSKKAQCKMDVIKFDATIFNTGGGVDIQALNDEQQKERVRNYLATQGILPPGKVPGVQASETTSETASQDELPAVGNALCTSNFDKTPAPTDGPACKAVIQNPFTAGPSLSKVPAANSSVRSSSRTRARLAANSALVPSLSKATASKTVALSEKASAKSVVPSEKASAKAVVPSKKASAKAAVPSEKASAKTFVPSEKASAKAVVPPEQASAKTVVPSEKPSTTLACYKPDYSSDIHVGFWKNNLSVSVYASLRYAKGRSCVYFRFHNDDVDVEIRAMEDFQSSQATLKIEAIELIEKFVKDCDASTRAYIKGCLEAKEIQNEQEQVVSDDEGGEDIPAEVNKEPEEKQPKKRKASARITGKKSAQSQRGVLGEIGKSVEEEPVHNTEAEGPGATVGQKTNAQASSSRTANPGEEKAAQRAKDTLIRAQKNTIREQEFQIARLQEQIRQHAQAVSASKPREDTVIGGKKVIDGQIYNVLASGRNAGKLLSKTWSKTFVNGVHYKEWTALSETTLHMGNNGGLIDAEQVGDLTFSRVPDGEHKGKLVQNVTEQSLIETRQGKFIRWIIREKLEPERSIL